MKFGFVALACSTALVLGASVAAAQDVTFTFKGTIHSAEGSPFSGITGGTPFTGSYTFTLSAPDQNDHPQVGHYQFTAFPYGVTVQIGSHRFSSNPDNVDFQLEQIDGLHSMDNYLFRSYNNLLTEGLLLETIEFQLDDYTQMLFDSTALSNVPPDLTNADQSYGLTITGAGYSFMLRGTITELQYCSYADCMPGPSVPPGPAGPQGPAGPEGPAGPQGEPGPAGPQGPQGPEGLQGPDGVVGPQGVAGPTGPHGATGPAGSQGPAGLQGAQGSEGLQGPAGAQGETGPKGEGLFAGAMVMVATGSPAPAGYTYLGTFTLVPSVDPRPRTLTRVDVYRKN